MLSLKTFDIRYVKLHFTIEFLEDTELPVYKASALRGGMGEMLLRANCVRDRECEKCDFESECIVRRTMYSKMEIQPSFMTSGDSVGYVIECEDYRDRVEAGDTLRFNLILFGKTIVYFTSFFTAFYGLGTRGLGKADGKFSIVSVTNSRNMPIFDGEKLNMDRYEILKVADYISFRKGQLKNAGPTGLKFQSPLSVKYRGEELRAFDPIAIMESACRRIYMLDCFEGIESNVHDLSFIEALTIPELRGESHRYVSVRRFSNHQGSAMYLKGIEGEMHLSAITDEALDILLAGELVHIGKNTSFGFGRYRVC